MFGYSTKFITVLNIETYIHYMYYSSFAYIDWHNYPHVSNRGQLDTLVMLF